LRRLSRENTEYLDSEKSEKGSAKINGKGRERGKERSPRVWDPGAPQTSFSATSVDLVESLRRFKRSEANNNNHKINGAKKCCNAQKYKKCCSATKMYKNVAVQHRQKIIKNKCKKSLQLILYYYTIIYMAITPYNVKGK
jgi:hypothetical protein